METVELSAEEVVTIMRALAMLAVREHTAGEVRSGDAINDLVGKIMSVTVSGAALTMAGV